MQLLVMMNNEDAANEVHNKINYDHKNCYVLIGCIRIKPKHREGARMHAINSSAVILQIDWILRSCDGWAHGA